MFTKLCRHEVTIHAKTLEDRSPWLVEGAAQFLCGAILFEPWTHCCCRLYIENFRVIKREILDKCPSSIKTKQWGQWVKIHEDKNEQRILKEKGEEQKRESSKNPQKVRFSFYLKLNLSMVSCHISAMPPPSPIF